MSAQDPVSSAASAAPAPPAPLTLHGPRERHPLVIGAAALIIVPGLFHVIGLTPAASGDVVLLAIAAMGLNLLVGFTGLTSFGHGAFLGIGAYAAALAQTHWFKDGFVLPVIFSLLFTAVLSTVIGFLILRRRGVYFSLLTLAFSALTFAVAFRWTDLTGGENGIGGIVRPAIGPVNLDNAVVYLVVVSVIGWGVLWVLYRVLNSPLGHGLVAIRENEQRARFQGFDTQRCKLTGFVISATVTGLAGALFAFHWRFASAEPTSVAFSGELLAIVVIGGMRSLLGPALGALFYVLFREFLSMWTQDWLLYFGLMFVGFVLFSPSGLVGIWQTVRNRLHPPPNEAAAMSARRIQSGVALPAFLKPPASQGAPLVVDKIGISFGGIHAVREASLSVDSGIHALIGPNGAGKTTAFNLISGMFAPQRGTVSLYGEPVNGQAPHRIAAQGLARSFQITSLFKGLSIHENLRLSLQARGGAQLNAWRAVDDDARLNLQTRELIRYLGLDGIEQVTAGSLSYGGQRLVDMGIALGSKPKVLLLDEPLAGLAAAERERVGNLIVDISRDIPVLIVEHDIDRVLGFSQQVTVMNDGAVLMSGSPQAVRDDPRVQAIYTGSGTPPVVGRAAAAAATAAGVAEHSVLLQFEGVNSSYGKSHILRDATLDVRRGEIVALLGRNGAGKSTLLKTLVGLVPPTSGRIVFDGVDLAGLSAPDIARLGIGYVPQGRGLFAGMSVRDNLSLGRLKRQNADVGGVVWSEEKILDAFPRIRERLDSPADYLSGGEQQMVAVARALSGNIKLLLLDEPFEGLAPTIVQELFRVFDRLRAEIPIVIVEHNLDLVLALADRVFALERGAVFHEGPAQPLLDDHDYRKKILWL